jgi:hypothetical protein
MTTQQADHRGLWDDKPYEDWTYHTPHTRPTWDSEKMAIYHKVSGAMKQARFHGGRWQYQKDASTWKNCGMKRNLILRTYKMQQQVVQNTIVVEGDDEDSHKCNICLEDVQFPMSNGCCSFKFCKDCYGQMPREQKRICSGCRVPTPFTGNATQESIEGKNIREWYNLFRIMRIAKDEMERSLDTAEERITEYQTNLMSANTRNEELLEEIETHKADIDFYQFELKNKKHFLEEARSALVNQGKMHKDRIDELEKNVNKYQMMYNKVIRMSIMLMVMLLFSVLR